MAELLPTQQARQLSRALVDYLATTFALTDPDAQRALEEFLHDEADGIFTGPPYVRLKLPFAHAADGWQHALEWLPTGFEPYAHQAAAFARLTSHPGPGGRTCVPDSPPWSPPAPARARPRPSCIRSSTMCCGPGGSGIRGGSRR